MTRLIAAILLSLYVSPVVAQQPRVYRDTVEPHWFRDNTRFWYRVDVSARQHGFVVVDAAAGTRQNAFDHKRVAAAMSNALGTDVRADALPIDSLEFADDSEELVLAGEGRTWQFDSKTGELTLASQDEDTTASSRLFLPEQRSHDRGPDTEFAIINELSHDVELIWIEGSGEHHSYGMIAPGKTRRQHTFVGHAWLLKSSDGSKLAAFVARRNNPDLKLNDAALANVRRGNESDGTRGRRPNRDVDQENVSPDGKWKAFVQDHDLWLKSTDDAVAPVRLSQNASGSNTFQKDASRKRSLELQYSQDDEPVTAADVRWSPDSKFVLAFQTVPVEERRVYYVESAPDDQLQPKLHSYPYTRPGDPIPISKPRLFCIGQQQEIPISDDLFPNPWQLRFLSWSHDGGRCFLLYNERGHQTLRVLEINCSDGHVRAVIDEHSDTFIHYSASGKFELEWLPDDQLLWASERSGWNHLYRYDIKSGDVVNAVTSGDWNVRRIEHIDREKQQLWFYSVGIRTDQDPYHEHFCRVNFDGSGLTILTEGDGTHEIAWSPDRKYFIDRYSRVDLPPIHELRRSDTGALVCLLEEADADEILNDRGSLPERFVAKGRDGQTDIWGIIHRPRDFDPEKRYPVIENIYAGPHDHHVPKEFQPRYHHQHQIADRGFIVVQIDGMGTAWRSKAFHDVCYKNLRDAGFPDRIAWLKAAAQKFPEMDLSQVGIYGGSAGGQNAMAALLWHGTFYKAAVADCGCHDNRMDKIWWNEQWMGWPVDDSYAQNSNTQNAHRLTGHLMLVVGEADRNVDPATTTQVAHALVKADKDFDFVLVPGAGHGACETPWAARRRADFFVRHLQQDSNE
ncbi:MAG: prolyl oligopeptidase family serine peptidase [Planctomycetaceae bacterium]